MSPGNTMVRVYGTLKARIMAGEYLPGERLDPGRLATGLAASRTPVRDALLQLSGERLVDSWEQEGFRVPLVNEAAIRDMYEWSNDVIHAAIRAASRKPGPSHRPGDLPDLDYAGAVGTCFLDIADYSSNREHRAAVSNLVDRSAAVRRAESIIVEAAMDDVEAIQHSIASFEWAAAARAVDQFHRRRIRLVAEIAAALRSREPRA